MRFFGRSEKKPIRAVCVGDSTTAGVGAWMVNYPEQLARRSDSRFVFLNCGAGGRTAMPDGLENDGTPSAYIDTEAWAGAKAFLPDLALLMLGTNDAKTINAPFRANGGFLRGLRGIAETILALKSNPVLFIMTSPASPKPSFQIDIDVIRCELAPAQRELAAALGCPLIDIFQQTDGHPEYFRKDGIHPNGAGCGIIARAVKAAIQKEIKL